MTSLREHNRHRIIDVLRGAGAVSRAEIARRTGLSRSTVSSLVGELEDAGVVVEAANAVGVAHGTQGGRPPTLVSLDRSAGVAVGIDFGHGHLAVAVADLAHTVLAEARHDLGVDHEAAWGMRSAAELVGRLLAKAGVDRGQVLGVGMALPGPIDPISGTVGSSSILPGWIGVRAAEEMSRVLGMTVQVDNDANLGALAERAWGAGRDCATLAFIKVASGIGGGLIIDGRVHHGRSGAAGEIGHITVDEMGAVCRCGNRGCLETVAAAPAQLDLLRRAHGDGLTLDRLLALAAAETPAADG